MSEPSMERPSAHGQHVVLEALVRLAVTRPWHVLAVAALLTVGAAAVAPRIRIVTDRSSLVSSDDPALVRYREVSEMFGSLSVAVVVLEGSERQALRDGADAVAEALEREPSVRSVFYRLDLGFFMRHGLVYLDATQLRCVRAAVGGGAGFTDLPETTEPGLIGLIQGIEHGIGSASAEMQIPRQCQALNPLTIMGRFFAEIALWIDDRERDAVEVIDRSDLAGESMAEYGVDEHGYLVNADGQTPHLVIMVVQPAANALDEDAARALTTMLRRVAGGVAAERGLRAGVTGMPAIMTDEMDTVRRDVRQTILSAIVFVLLLFVATFRSLRATIIVAIPLVLGLVWTAGFAALAYTRLTMVSVYFAAVLFGLGIAFAIHLLARFDEGLRAGEEPRDALRTAMVGAGPGIITGGVTTAAAFLAVGLVEFQGFAQLGVVAGVGVLLMLAGSLTVMPVALWKWRGKPLREPRTRAWLGSFGSGVVRVRVLVAALAVAAVGFGVYAARSIEFDYDFYKLLPRDGEAIRYYRVLVERSDFASDIAISVADSLEQAEQRRADLQSLDTVARAEAITRYLPGTAEEQHAKVEAIRRVAVQAAGPLKNIRDQSRAALDPERSSDPVKVAAALESLADTVEDAWFAAQQTKRGEAADLEKLRDTIRASAAKLEAAPADVGARRLGAFERKVFGDLAEGAETLLRNLEHPEVMEPEDLPADVRERFVATGPDGRERYAVYAYPTGRVGDREFLVRFIDEARTVDPDITGFPVTHYYHGAMASRAFFQAALYASIAVLLLLIVDFRSFRHVVLAAIPLLVGAASLLGTMVLAGWEYNFVNVVAFPLVIGAGVDFGVHLVHRARQEGSVVGALRTTGRPVILSAVTTIVGMGGLATAEHRGAASLGLLLVLGIGLCLVAAATVLPAVMSFWGGRPERGAAPPRLDATAGPDE